MQIHGIPTNVAGFRVGRHFLKSGAGFRVLGQHPDLAAWPKHAREITTAFTTFPRWNVTNVCQYLPQVEDGFVTMAAKKIDFSGMPSFPPFGAVWLEAEDFGWAWAMPMRYDATSPGRFIGLPIYWDYSREDVPRVSDNRFMYEWDELGMLGRPGGRERDDDESPDITATYETLFSRITNVMVLSFIFAHCKNVTLEERMPSRQQQRAAVRRGKPILKWHEIVIDPHAARQPSTGEHRANDHPKRSLHIARGHFATYTEDRPLFGKYVGTFWRPAHVRGAAEAGAVFTDYRVKA